MWPTLAQAFELSNAVVHLAGQVIQLRFRIFRRLGDATEQVIGERQEVSYQSCS